MNKRISIDEFEPVYFWECPDCLYDNILKDEDPEHEMVLSCGNCKESFKIDEEDE
jgi:hypothetical protein